MSAARRSPFKPLHWVKVSRAMQGSLWAELQKHADAHRYLYFTIADLVLFSAVVPKSKDSSKSDGRQKSAGSKSDKVHLLIILIYAKLFCCFDFMQHSYCSEKLKEIMKKILHLGNTLNQGTARGSAVGFRLDSLLKLSDTRATNNRMTLMHYLCKVLAEKSAHLLDFHEDLVSLEAASKIQLKSMAEEQQAIVKGLEKVELELTASESDGPVSEIFCKTLKEFTAVSGAEVRSLTSLYNAVGKNADSLAMYFGEDPARCPFEQVVSTLLNFVRIFRKAHEENCKQAELEKKKAQKEAETEKSKEANIAKNVSR
ncbi:unnamed protein product [Musa textilis]